MIMQLVQTPSISHAQLAGSAATVAGSLAKSRASTSSTATSSTSATAAEASSATITANDFLTLLVAEMKNQDPTTPTDPTQYISQMVDVNSLQQLIGINQGITSLDTAAGTTATTPVSSTTGG
jgi:flagellar basal-body rod modification protein FlgD